MHDDKSLDHIYKRVVKNFDKCLILSTTNNRKRKVWESAETYIKCINFRRILVIQNYCAVSPLRRRPAAFSTLTQTDFLSWLERRFLLLSQTTFLRRMSSPLGVVDQELLLSYSQNDTKNDFNATIGIGGSEGYEFTVISIATSVLLGVMTLTTIIGRNIIITHCSFTRLNLKKMALSSFALQSFQ